MTAVGGGETFPTISRNEENLSNPAETVAEAYQQPEFFDKRKLSQMNKTEGEKFAYFYKQGPIEKPDSKFSKRAVSRDANAQRFVSPRSSKVSNLTRPFQPENKSEALVQPINQGVRNTKTQQQKTRRVI